MNIGVYARGLTNRLGGVKEVILQTLKAMILKLEGSDTLYIFHCSDTPIFNSEKTNVIEVYIPYKGAFVTDLIIAPRVINKTSVDVMWFPKNVIPFGVRAKTVVTIHDLAYFLPEYNAYQFADTVYMKTMIRSTVKRTDKIITVSENTKKDVVEILNVPEKNVTTVYSGVGDEYHIIDDEARKKEVRVRYDLPERFVLFTGGVTPRKNILRAIDAFLAANIDESIHFVITGLSAYKTKDVFEKVEKEPRIHITGFVADDDMPVLYNLALLFMYPSLYEGFGLPVLEAQASGIPVIASNTSSIPEVGGAGARYIDPRNVSEMAGAYETVCKDSAERATLVAQGFENVKKFTWGQTAEQLLQKMKEGEG